MVKLRAIRVGSRQARLYAICLALGHLLLHLLVQNLYLPSIVWNNVLGWIVLATANWISIAACIWISLDEEKPQRVRWWLYAGSVAFQSIGVLLYLLRSVALPSSSHSPGLPIYFLLLSSTPLYFALSLSLDHSETTLVRRLDQLSALAMAILFFLLVFSIVTISGASTPEQAHIVDLISISIIYFLPVMQRRG